MTLAHVHRIFHFRLVRIIDHISRHCRTSSCCSSRACTVRQSADTASVRMLLIKNRQGQDKTWLAGRRPVSCTYVGALYTAPRIFSVTDLEINELCSANGLDSESMTFGLILQITGFTSAHSGTVLPHCALQYVCTHPHELQTRVVRFNFSGSLHRATQQ